VVGYLCATLTVSCGLDVVYTVVYEQSDSTEARNFSLMMKNQDYWGDSLMEAQRVDAAARPICRPYLHGFGLGLAQTMAHGQR